MCGMAECAAMAATWRCHQEGCWPKTDGLTAVLVRVLWVWYFHGFFWGTIILDVDDKKILTSSVSLILYA
jgi:hypothetical protein